MPHPAQGDSTRPAAAADEGLVPPVSATWLVAAFGVIAGVTMTYAPWEFGAALFRSLVPNIRLLGSLFLIGGALLSAAALHARWPRVVADVASGLLVAVVGVYWWQVVRTSGLSTGGLLYPLVLIALMLESLPRVRGRSLFAPLVATLGFALGLRALSTPEAVRGLYGQYGAHLQWSALVFLAGSVLLATGLWRKHARAAAVGSVLLAAAFGIAAVLALSVRSWLGATMYALLTLGCLVQARFPDAAAPSGLRFALLRVIALACVLPLLALGSLASAVGQRAVAAQVRDKVSQATSAEIAWLVQRERDAEATVQLSAHGTLVARWVETRDAAGMQAWLDRIEAQSGVIDAIWILDAHGNPVAGSRALRGLPASAAGAGYFQDALRTSGVALSRPFLAPNGKHYIGFSSRIVEGDRVMGVVAAGVAVESLSVELTPTSKAYRVRVVDVRDGSVLRDTLGLAADGVVPADLEGSGVEETFGASGELQLVSRAEVPGTPWRVLVSTPLRDAYAPLVKLGGAVIAMTLLAMLLSLVLAHAGAHEIIRRLRKLRSAFRNVAGAPEPAPAHAQDELARLEGAFARMAEDIERSQAELRAAVKVREEFLSIASHELRTPLTVLRGTLDLWRRRGSAQLDASDIERMRRQIERLTRLVSDLLDTSRLRNGQLSLERASIDAAVVLREAVDRVRTAQPARAARLDVALPEPGLRAVWDDQRVEQVVTNLLENAFRYSPEDSRITLRAEATDGIVRLTVTDQGIGIPPESLPSLFKPFYRAPNASTMHAGGLGLGLSICRQIAEGHGGRLWAESDGPGKGSRFLLELPLV